MKNRLIILFILSAMAMPLMSGNTVGFQELDINQGARAMALGNAYAGVSDDPGAVFSNIAGISQIDKPEFSFSYRSWFLDTSFQYLTGIVPVSIGNIAVSLSYANMGVFERIDEDGYLTGETITSYGLNFMVGYSNYVYNYYGDMDNADPTLKLSIGASLKGAMQDDGYGSAYAVAGDFGVMAEILSYIKIGIVIQNLRISAEDGLPSNLKIGMSWKAYASPLHTVILAFDYKQKLYDGALFSIGTEYAFLEQYFLRFGYEFNPQYLDGSDTLKGLNGGLGIIYNNFVIDYTITTHGSLGTNHIFGITIRL